MHLQDSGRPMFATAGIRRTSRHLQVHAGIIHRMHNLMECPHPPHPSATAATHPRHMPASRCRIQAMPMPAGIRPPLWGPTPGESCRYAPTEIFCKIFGSGNFPIGANLRAVQIAGGIGIPHPLQTHQRCSHEPRGPSQGTPVQHLFNTRPSRPGNRSTPGSRRVTQESRFC
jgi:hypothetical protein